MPIIKYKKTAESEVFDVAEIDPYSRELHRLILESYSFLGRLAGRYVGYVHENHFTNDRPATTKGLYGVIKIETLRTSEELERIRRQSEAEEKNPASKKENKPSSKPETKKKT